MCKAAPEARIGGWGLSMTVIASIARAAACFVALAVPAQALNTRTWISGTGVDQAGCGPIASPCRTLQFAHDQTAAAGEINVKDPAGYGSVVITKSISIIGDGSFAGVLAASSGNAITINAGAADNIFLKSLAIEGAGLGSNGIAFNAGRSLVVANCLARGFAGSGATGNGIFIGPVSGTSSITIVDTILSGNGFAGLQFFPQSGAVTTKVIAARVLVDGNGTYGISVNNVLLTGGSTKFQIDDAIVSHNGTSGILTGGGTSSPGTVVIDNTKIFDHPVDGVRAIGQTVSLRRSTITGNGTGVFNLGSATVRSYRDNTIEGNGTDISGTVTTATPQ